MSIERIFKSGNFQIGYIYPNGKQVEIWTLNGKYKILTLLKKKVFVKNDTRNSFVPNVLKWIKSELKSNDIKNIYADESFIAKHIENLKIKKEVC